MRRRTYTNDEIAAAVAAAGGDKTAAARSLGCSGYVISRFQREENIPTPRRAVVRWDPATVARLREIALQNPRPPIEEIAAEFGTTVSGVQTAMSKFGITKNSAPVSRFGKPSTPANYTRRACMCCSRPFVSEGSHNRLCVECKSGNRSAA
jgi:hypothetical protein